MRSTYRLYMNYKISVKCENLKIRAAHHIVVDKTNIYYMFTTNNKEACRKKCCYTTPIQ